MTDQDPEPEDVDKPWWQGEGMPDIEAILGEEGMEVVGTVADEALKLFVVMRERFAADTLPPDAAESAGESAGSAGSTAEAGESAQSVPASPWGALLEQLATTAVQAVNELAAAGGQMGGPGAQMSPPGAQPLGNQRASADEDWVEEESQTSEEPVVLPGEAAACSYCPICQTIALFRSVPMSTWQRLAASIVEVADAAREFTGNGAQSSAPIVVTPQTAPAQSAPVTVDDVLAGIVEPEPSDAGEAEEGESAAESGAAESGAGESEAAGPGAGESDAGEAEAGDSAQQSDDEAPRQGGQE